MNLKKSYYLWRGVLDNEERQLKYIKLLNDTDRHAFIRSNLAHIFPKTELELIKYDDVDLLLEIMLGPKGLSNETIDAIFAPENEEVLDEIADNFKLTEPLENRLLKSAPTSIVRTYITCRNLYPSSEKILLEQTGERYKLAQRYICEGYFNDEFAKLVIDRGNTDEILQMLRCTDGGYIPTQQIRTAILQRNIPEEVIALFAGRYFSEEDENTILERNDIPAIIQCAQSGYASKNFTNIFYERADTQTMLKFLAKANHVNENLLLARQNHLEIMRYLQKHSFENSLPIIKRGNHKEIMLQIAQTRLTVDDIILIFKRDNKKEILLCLLKNKITDPKLQTMIIERGFQDEFTAMVAGLQQK